MEKTLLIVLLVVEIVAFGWLIIEAKISRKQRDTILEVEKQILKLERTIIKQVSGINDFTKREKLLLDNEKLIKNNGNKL